jgi:uncharacterized membrane protein YidH (DUF202 family)
MFSFGFAIAQFFHFLARQQASAEISTGPRWLGIALICVGIVVLVIAVVEHLLNIRKLKEQGLPADFGSFIPIGSTAAIFALGVVALTTVFLGWQL